MIAMNLFNMTEFFGSMGYKILKKQDQLAEFLMKKSFLALSKTLQLPTNLSGNPSRMNNFFIK